MGYTVYIDYVSIAVATAEIFAIRDLAILSQLCSPGIIGLLWASSNTRNNDSSLCYVYDSFYFSCLCGGEGLVIKL